MLIKTQINRLTNSCHSRLSHLAVLSCVMFFTLLLYLIIQHGSVFNGRHCEMPDARIMNKYQEQTKTRAEFLKNNVKVGGHGILYNALVPEVFCKNLIRIGVVGDGGKWICNPNNLLSSEFPNCTIYSLGINNDPSFEEDLQIFLNKKCSLRSVDKNDQTPETIERIKNANGIFRKAFIGSLDNETSLKTVLSEFKDDRIDILKIDIEGAEYFIIDEILSVPICQILIEIHGETAGEAYKLLQIFSKKDYYLFSYEINGFLHYLSEYSFIHKSCFSSFSVNTVYGKYLS